MIRAAQRCQEASNATARFYMQKHDGKLDYIAPISDVAKCGEIWMCDLPEKSGSIQTGLRPVFILSNDKNNTHSSILNVIPMTTKTNKRNLPCHVVLENFTRYGLIAVTTIMVEQLTAINKNTLRFKVGEINDMETLLQICKAMKTQFPILENL